MKATALFFTLFLSLACMPTMSTKPADYREIIASIQMDKTIFPLNQKSTPQAHKENTKNTPEKKMMEGNK